MIIYVYDIEVYKNFFCVTFKNPRTKELRLYTIYHSYQNKENNINDLTELYKFIKINKNKWFCGYNSKFFDNQILNYIYYNMEVLGVINNEEIITKDLYDFAISIIEADNTMYKYNLPFRSIDLMRVGNVEQKSLKLVAVNLNWPLIQDLPYTPDSIINDEDLNILYKYNLNDVEITEKLFDSLQKDILVRWQMGQKYNIDLMSESNSGMANRLLEKMYSEMSGIPQKELKEMRTNREIIHYENIVFDSIKFQSKELNDLLKEIKSQIWYKAMPYFKKNVIFGGNKYQLGIGGIHSEDEPGIFEKTDTIDIIDCDVTSMYPNLMINNDIFPAHLGPTFLNLYKKIIKQRIEAKEAGFETEDYVLKISINSVFGKTLYEHHWLYDPLAGLRVTINGQLYMLMLIETLVLAGFDVISANTDGIVTIVPKEKKKLYEDACNNWINITNFELKYTKYNKYIRKDVNNYIVVKENGELKEKGEFLQPENSSLRQGIDKPIISKALYNFFIYNIPIEDTILNENSIYMFCIAKKVDNKFVNELHYLKNNEHFIEKLQKSVRFYISVNGNTLYKVDKRTNKYINYCVGRKVTILNNNEHNKNIKDYNIDYGYYIKETQKIIDLIINPQLTLW